MSIAQMCWGWMPIEDSNHSYIRKVGKRSHHWYSAYLLGNRGLGTSLVLVYHWYVSTPIFMSFIHTINSTFQATRWLQGSGLNICAIFVMVCCPLSFLTLKIHSNTLLDSRTDSTTYANRSAHSICHPIREMCLVWDTSDPPSLLVLWLQFYVSRGPFLLSPCSHNITVFATALGVILGEGRLVSWAMGRFGLILFDMV